MKDAQNTRRFAAVWGFSLFLLCGSLVVAQPSPLAKPEDLGLRIPAGKPIFENRDRRVLVSPDLLASKMAVQSKPVVARVYLEVGTHYVLIMPDGAIRSVEKQKTAETTRPFEPFDSDQLSESLKGEFPGFKTRATRHYLCVYNTTEGFCERKGKILESMYPMLMSYFRRQKLKPVEPRMPLVVVMFRTKKQFQEYRQMPGSLLAYYNGVNNRIYMYQYSGVSKDMPMIAVKQSTSTIAHEGVHQILHNIGVQKRLSSWPLWLSEGIAEYFAPTSTGVRAKWSGVGRPNELRMRELFVFLRKREQIGDGSMVNQVVTAEQLTSTDYAVAWLLVHYLTTKKKKQFFEYVREVSADLPLQPPEEELVRFMNHFGGDLRSLERELVKHLRDLPYTDPIANQPYFVIFARAGKKKMATVTTSLEWKKIQGDMLKKLPAAERPKAVFQIKSFPNRSIAVRVSQAYSK